MFKLSKDLKSVALIAISSCLLGIWGTVETIALRNILLVIGSMIAIVCWIEYIRNYIKYRNQKNLIDDYFVEWIPIFFVVLMLCWVVIHYYFFSIYQEQQWNELKSTWLRAALAALIGSAVGLSLQQKKNRLWLLWLGILFSFLVLIFQYIPKAIMKESLFAPDYFGNYIYWAKYNGVLMGSLLIAALISLNFDQYKYQEEIEYAAKKNYECIKKNLLKVYIYFGICIVSYSFIFIFNTKNGVVMALVLLLVGFSLGIVNIFTKRQNYFTGEVKRKKAAITLFYYLIVLALLTWMVSKHIKNSPGWDSIIEDVTISASVDRHRNWLNTQVFGYPHRKDGTTVMGNTYERVSWGVVGLGLVIENAYGVGILNAFPILIEEKFSQNIQSAYTHSAWVDLGLAFGWPGILFLPLSLLSCIILVLTNKNHFFGSTVCILSMTILILYSIGEYGFKHNVEILLFICSLNSTLILSKNLIIDDIKN